MTALDRHVAEQLRLVSESRGLSHATLVDLLSYDARTGVFTWRRTVHSHAIVGCVAGTKNRRGYIRIQINGQVYLAQRLAWFYVKGRWPEGVVVHRDGNRSNNAFSNLVDTDRAAAMQQRHAPQGSNRSGFVGVTFHPKSGKWAVQVVKKGVKRRHYGLYGDPTEASKRYQEIKRQLHANLQEVA